jgi:cellulose synthase/poly-beta-1,6-N-acetylglucosamine synthase-like glycosyltransferase
VKSANPVEANSISAIVPARNEAANIVRMVESLAAQPEIAEILVVDDHSTDRTPQLLRELAARIPQLRVLHAPALPPGWTGKNHAVWHAAQQATGDWLLFTDADTEHLPGAAARARADAAAHNAALVSYSPQQELPTWWERALLPFVFARLDAVARAAANGQFLMIRRAMYGEVGGHAAVAAEVLEDLRLAQRVRQAGGHIHFAPGAGIVKVRMYRSFAALWEGWRKNLYALVARTPGGLLRELLAIAPWPLLFLLLPQRQWHLLGLLLTLLQFRSHAFRLRRSSFAARLLIYSPLGLLLYTGVLLASAAAHARGVVAWKGREYPVPRS